MSTIDVIPKKWIRYIEFWNLNDVAFLSYLMEVRLKV